MAETKKYLDQEGVAHLWSKINMQDYPNNELLIGVIEAIDETKANKEYVDNKITDLVNSAITNKQNKNIIVSRDSNTGKATMTAPEIMEKVRAGENVYFTINLYGGTLHPYLECADTGVFFYSNYIDNDRVIGTGVLVDAEGNISNETYQLAHLNDDTIHITATERTNWNAAKTHADSAHAPSDAQKNQNAFSNIAVSGQTTVAADTATDTVTFAGSNVTITTDAANDKVTFSVADGSTSAKGVVQLTNSTSSTSTTTAATPNSVKSAYDLANTAKTNAATAQARADAAYTLAEGKVDSLSDLGITATAAELNYVDGVTSKIQTQLNAKMSKANPVGTGSFSMNRLANTTVGDYSHAEGSEATASGDSSHAEGIATTASNIAAHAEGFGTIADGSCAHVQGKYNISNTNMAHIVGNGISISTRSNAHTLDWDGNAWFAGDVYVGSTSGTDKDAGSVKLAKLSEIPTKTSDLSNDSGFLTSYTETDPTVPAWAKASTKPTYTASEVGADVAGTADTLVSTHANNKSNPHEVTAAQLGLKTESWTFTLEDGSTVTKVVYVG